MRGHLFLLRELVRRDFEGRYKGSLLGFLWSFLQPIWQLVLFSYVFSTVLKIPLTGERTESFGIFLFCGLMPWLAIHEGILRSSTAVTDNANLVKKIHFPSEMLIWAATLGGIIHQGIASLVFLGVLWVGGDLAWQGLPVLLLALPLQIGLTLGIGFLLASVHTFFRDIAQIVGMLLMGWFYVTPIVYSIHHVPEAYQPWIELNPLTALVGLYRYAFLGGDLVEALATIWPLVASSLALFACGTWLFSRAKPAFADEV